MSDALRRRRRLTAIARGPPQSRLRLHATRCSATATRPVRTGNEFRVLIDFLDLSFDFEKKFEFNIPSFELDKSTT